MNLSKIAIMLVVLGGCVISVISEPYVDEKTPKSLSELYSSQYFRNSSRDKRAEIITDFYDSQLNEISKLPDYSEQVGQNIRDYKVQALINNGISRLAPGDNSLFENGVNSAIVAVRLIGIKFNSCVTRSPSQGKNDMAKLFENHPYRPSFLTFMTKAVVFSTILYILAQCVYFVFKKFI